MENLDLKCAELGRELAGLNGVDEKLLTDALAVLEEQGVYAFFLYLKARGKNAGEEMSSKAREFLAATPQERSVLGQGDSDVFSALKTLAEKLDDLLLARDLLRQALVYARYHAKAGA
ncbi:MAG: hypothetical protein ACFCUO_10800 [Rhodospirillales bacterium]